MMQAYSSNDLDNLDLEQQAREAFEQGIISKQSFTDVQLTHPCNLYTPTFFIRIALALLCIVCISFAAFLSFLVLYRSDDFIIIFLLMFIACYVLLEYMVKTKKYYNAGIDNVLQIFTILFFAGMFADSNYPHQDLCICIAVIAAAAWLCIRFTDAFMGLIVFSGLIYCIYSIVSGSAGYNYLPFIFMLTATLIYFIQQYLNKKPSLHFYKKSFYIISIAALISVYAASNVYVINQLSNAASSTVITSSKQYILFWILSALIPALYMLYGFIKQNSLLLRLGFVCGTATVITLHFYYSILNIEGAFIISGSILLFLGWAGLKYFKFSRHGLTAKSYTTLSKDLINIESLISMQVGGRHSSQQNKQFGGGSSGGGGASGNW